MEQICKDLKMEQEELDAVVVNLDEASWETMTPSEGWNIKDQIRHLAYYDNRAHLAASDQEAFKKWFEEIKQKPDEWTKHEQTMGRDRTGEGTLKWWREERTALLDVLIKMDRKTRLYWYGPALGAMTFVTARLMETWAHGQDVFDALHLQRKPTDRLRNIAHMGVGAFSFSYANRKMEPPETPVRVELSGPSGDIWSWGPEDAKDTVKGPAEDFCLVVVQRRHVADTNLDITGETAQQWMSIAQVFAGPPTGGRKPDTFPKSS